MTPAGKQLGAIVRKVRREMHMGLRAFGAELGVTPSAVFNWEEGIFLPTPEHLEALQALAPGWAPELDELWVTAREQVCSHYRGCRS